MKYLFAYAILFCLVFLNAPKQWVHDCEHHIPKNDDTGMSLGHFDSESCFVCDFDLGFYNVESPSFISNLSPVSASIRGVVVRQRSAEPILQLPLRGPPTV